MVFKKDIDFSSLQKQQKINIDIETLEKIKPNIGISSTIEFIGISSTIEFIGVSSTIQKNFTIDSTQTEYLEVNYDDFTFKLNQSND